MNRAALASEAGLIPSPKQIKEMERKTRLENLGRSWYKFSRNSLSLVGGGMVLLVILLAIFAPVIAPYPEHVKPFTDFANAKLPPSLDHLFGTDEIGRDILSRVIFGFQNALLMGVVVLALVVPPGVLLGLVAGYYQGTRIDTVIMRITDIFLAVPPLILALAVASILNESGRLPRRVEPASGLLFDGVEVVALPGHTRSQHGLRFDCDGLSVVVAGDAVATRDFFRERRSFFNAADFQLSAKSMDRLADMADIIVPGHDNYFLSDGSGRKK